MLTMGCNAQCAHCSVEASPARVNERFSRVELLKLIRRAGKGGIGRLIFTGGEPFLFQEDLLVGIMTGSIKGMSVGVRTNCFWATSKRKAGAVLGLMKLANLSSIGASYDYYHSEFINYQRVKNVLDVASELGIYTYLDWASKASGREIYECIGSDMRFIRDGLGFGLLRLGRAKGLPEGHFTQYPLECLEFEVKTSFGCGDLRYLALWAYPNGYVCIDCCQGNKRLFFRRPYGEAWVKRLCKEAGQDKAVLFMHEQGVGGLIRKARQEYPELLKPTYSHQCELCCELLPVLFPR